MSSDHIEEVEIVEEEVEEINEDSQLETELIVPDEPQNPITEDSASATDTHQEEQQHQQQTVQPIITTVQGKTLTTIDASQLPMSKDGKPIQYKLLNINGSLKLVPFITTQIQGSSTVENKPITTTVENNTFQGHFLNHQKITPPSLVPLKNETAVQNVSQQKQSCDVEPSEYRLWSTNATRLLIELYKKYQGKVTTGEIKSWKRCWEIIADDINKLVPEVNISGCHAENRWRVLVRNYKKYLTKTSYKKFFEYAKEFNEINSMKERPYVPYKKEEKNENSSLMILTHHPQSTNHPQTFVTQKLIPIKPRTDMLNQNSHQIVSVQNGSTTNMNLNGRNNVNIVRKKFSKVNIFRNMRQDRLRYYRQRIKIEKVKIQLEREKIVAMKQKNKLMKERNDILANFSKNSVLYDICTQ